jgi:hypothetical protein
LIGIVVVHLAAATICFSGSCHPVLLGDATPKGVFKLTHYATDGYGGDVLVYKEDDKIALAIHRVINVPGQQRKERLKSGTPVRRIHVTAGCINIDPTVYEDLVGGYSDATLVIEN